MILKNACAAILFIMFTSENALAKVMCFNDGPSSPGVHVIHIEQNLAVENTTSDKASLRCYDGQYGSLILDKKEYRFVVAGCGSLETLLFRNQLIGYPLAARVTLSDSFLVEAWSFVAPPSRKDCPDS